ncbi:MAG: guanylate kinase [Chloroflexi bacterium]|nr:guanylate kinase [Chloroflexota bacterium]
MVIVLSGPSGVGKDAVLSRMRELGSPFHFTITATTRPQRASERDRVDYIFVSRDTFREMIERDELLEWAEVYENLYGVPKPQVRQALERGQDVIIKVDVQGAASIKKLAPEAVFVFLAPPSIDELTHRLTHRMTESADALKLRLETAEREIGEASKFDHVVINHDNRLDDAVKEIEAIASKERRRSPTRRVFL